MIKTVKYYISFILCVITFVNVNAQVPEAMSYQAVARDASGNPMMNASLLVIFEIRQTSSSGMVAYSELQNLTTNQFGLFTAQIGSVLVPISGVFSNISWGSDSYYLHVEVNGDAIGASKLLSVPYALYSKNGPTGPAGPAGPQGLKGDTGVAGPQGPMGAANIVGTNGYVIKFLGTNQGVNSQIFDNGTHVGIGTASPQSILHMLTSDTIGHFIEGTNSFGIYNLTKSLSGNNAGELYISGTDTVFKSLEPSKQSFYMSYPKSGGTIGIAADTIEFWGSVSKTSVRNNGDFYNNDTIFTQNLYVFENSSNSGDVLTNIGGGRTQWQAPSAVTPLWNTSGLTISNANVGNVGIGVIGPTRKFEVWDNSSSFATHIQQNSTTGDGLYIYSNTSSSTRMLFQAIGNSGGMYVKGNGDVGVGITTPNDKMHVMSGGNGTRVRIENSSNGWAGIDVKNTLGEMFIGVQGPFDPVPGEFHIFDNYNGGQRMVIDAIGYVGIGTPNPMEKLDVSGKVQANDFVYSTPKVFHYSLGGASFSPAHTITNYHSSIFGNGQAYLTNENGWLAADVHLPDGAVITGIQIMFEDDAPQNMAISLVGYNLQSFTSSIHSYTSNQNAPGVLTYTNTAINYVIDNSNWAYYVRAYAAPWSNQTVGNRLNIRSVVLTYEMPSTH